MNRKLSIHKAGEIECLSRYETLYTDGNVDESCNSYDSSTSSDGSFKEISSGNIPKKNRKILTKRKEVEGKDKYAKSKLLKKEKVVYNQLHNILTLLDVLTNFSFATSETMCDYYDYYL